MGRVHMSEAIGVLDQVTPSPSPVPFYGEDNDPSKRYLEGVRPCVSPTQSTRSGAFGGTFSLVRRVKES